MKINQHPHACPGSPLSDSHCRCQIIVTAAVAVSVGIIGGIPYSDADIVDTSFRQQVEKSLVIQFFSCKVVIFYTTVFQRYIGRYIHAADKIIRQVFHTLYIDLCLHRIQNLFCFLLMQHHIIQIHPVTCIDCTTEFYGEFCLFCQSKYRGSNSLPYIPSLSGRKSKFHVIDLHFHIRLCCHTLQPKRKIVSSGRCLCNRLADRHLGCLTCAVIPQIQHLCFIIFCPLICLGSITIGSVLPAAEADRPCIGSRIRRLFEVSVVQQSGILP